jgi:hypothetical protein
VRRRVDAPGYCDSGTVNGQTPDKLGRSVEYAAEDISWNKRFHVFTRAILSLLTFSSRAICRKLSPLARKVATFSRSTNVPLSQGKVEGATVTCPFRP